MIFIIWAQSWAAGWTKCVCMCICNHPHMVFCKPCSSSGHGRCCRSHVHLLRIHLTSSESKLVLRGSVYCRTVPLCRAPPHFDLLTRSLLQEPNAFHSPFKIKWLSTLTDILTSPPPSQLPSPSCTDLTSPRFLLQATTRNSKLNCTLACNGANLDI